MDKQAKDIMVVPRDLLFKEGAFSGFLSAEQGNFEDVVLNSFRYMKRGLAEKDPSFKQPIAYAVIANPAMKRVFAYQRTSKASDYGEARLMGKWSWGVGGHIERCDSNGGNPLYYSLKRELREEIGFEGEVETETLGYINDDKNDVGRVHFGILYLVETGKENVRPESAEMKQGGLYTVKELEELASDESVTVETWSELVLPSLKSRLKSPVI